MTRLWLITGLALATVATSVGGASAATLEPIADPSDWGSDPIHAASPPGDPRLFVVERGGDVRLVKDGALQETPFLEVPNVDTGGERGLLSIAFPPDYSSSGLFYVFTVAAGSDTLDPAGKAGDLRIVEYRRSTSDPDLADPTSARLVLKQEHSAGNHNGGQIAFGSEGFLYITVGDNASSANAQSLANIFGKVLRIDPRDPEGAATYSIPESNPFFEVMGARKEIYALGLRNPFRASFGPDGELAIGDVGESSFEEVDLGSAGANYGWPTCEGACANPLFTNPVFQYPHGPLSETTGCAIIGGYVVRDPGPSTLTGRFLYGDLCRADLRTLDLSAPGADPKPAGLTLPNPAARLLGFGEDASGRVYVMTEENAYRVTPETSELGGGSTIASTPLGFELVAGKQRLRGYVDLIATCTQACLLSASGKIRTPRSRPALTRSIPSRSLGYLVNASRSAGAGERAHLRLRIRKRTRLRALKALEAGRGVWAQLRVVATDTAGGSGVADYANPHLTAGKRKR